MDVLGARRILIRGTNWIGDSVIAIPALREIRKLFPQAHITLMVRPWVSDIFQSAEYIDDLLIYDKSGSHKGLRGFFNLVRELRRREFDVAILLQNAIEAALMAALAGIPNRIGYPTDGRGLLLTHQAKRVDGTRRDHQVFYYLRILSACAAPAYAPDPAFRPDITIPLRLEELAWARAILESHRIAADRHLVGLNPGAYYGSAKRWFTERYASLADRLIERDDAEVLIFGSAGERRIMEEIVSLMKFKPKVLTGKTTLRELMALIKLCDLFITNDSGPMHLAAALDVPQIAIFGSTDEHATGPLSEKATVIKHPVPCSPCLLRECPIDLRCFAGVSVDQVYSVAHRTLSP
jgi:heptosyltransferase-2